MSTKELIGKVVMVRWPHEHSSKVRVRVVATGSAFGRPQLLVSPEAGTGVFWVRKWEEVEENDST